MLAGLLSLSTARCWQDKRASHQGIEHRTIVSEGDLHTYLFVFIVNKLLRCVTSISYGNRGCWQACYLCLLPGAHKTLANTVNGQNRIFSQSERIPWPEFNFCVNMNLFSIIPNEYWLIWVVCMQIEGISLGHWGRTQLPPAMGCLPTMHF